MAYKIKYSKRAIKNLDKIKNNDIKRIIFLNIEALKKAPLTGKLLSGKARQKGIRSLRIITHQGEYRSLYAIKNKIIIFILIIGTRETIYKTLEKSLDNL